MTAHARLSPSGAHCWAECTASIHAVEEARRRRLIPEDESNDAADEGTAAHEIREACFLWGADPHDFVGQKVTVNGKDWPITTEMADFLAPGIDWVRERAGDSRMLVEERVSLDPWLPGQFGTIDCAFLWTASDGVRELVLSDLKYGFVRVEAEGNPQQMIYALGALKLLFGSADRESWPVSRARVVIDQPRKGGLKEWVVEI